jgi:hypothetical protein
MTRAAPPQHVDIVGNKPKLSKGPNPELCRAHAASFFATKIFVTSGLTAAVCLRGRHA